MAQNDNKLTLDEYLKLKKTLVKNKLKLTFPWFLKACLIIPLVYGLFLFIYYLAYIRFQTIH